MSAPSAPRAIRRLDEGTVQRIAAGEVVERPASVVKELVENAVDAGARDVRVRLEGGGLELIAVEDDGAGIAGGDLPLAVERHATSKLERVEDLAAIATLGFRGEALASIAAVSRLRLLSRVAGAPAASGISVVAGQVVGTFVEGRAPGTTVEVRDLFFNTPARRKFLHAPAAEQLEVLAMVERLYLARPAVGLAVDNERGELARYPPVRSLREAAGRVFGPEFLGQSFAVAARPAEGIAIQAVLARPAISRSTSSSLFLALNGRAIASRPLAQAVRIAYADHLPRTRHPVGAIHLEVDPSRVDVNVHPTKREVRIAHERDLADELRRAVREALLGTPQVADRAGAVGRPTGFLPPAPSSPVGPLPPLAALPRAAEESPHAVQRTLGEPPAPVTVAATARRPRLAFVGQLFRVYWAAESGEDLLLVDQHAASERAIFTALRRDGRLAHQELVDPLRFELTPRQALTLSTHGEAIARSGFRAAPFGGNVVRIEAVPSYRGRRARAEAFPGLLDELAVGGRPTVPDGLAERTDATLACHSAVRAGDLLLAEELARIVEALDADPEGAYTCPHGRPILVRIPRARIDRWFLRSGP